MKQKRDKTYKQIILEILQENSKGLALQEIYFFVKERKENRSEKWKNIVRNNLHFSRFPNKKRAFRKDGDLWRLNEK